jgi:hypothetical protein
MASINSLRSKHGALLEAELHHSAVRREPGNYDVRVTAEDFQWAAELVRIAGDILVKEAPSQMEVDLTRRGETAKKIIATLQKHGGETTGRVISRALPMSATTRHKLAAPVASGPFSSPEKSRTPDACAASIEQLPVEFLPALRVQFDARAPEGLCVLKQNSTPQVRINDQLRVLHERGHYRLGCVQKQFAVSDEQFWVLKVSAMPGVGIHNQLRIGDVLRQSEGIDRRHHYVVVAVND